MPSKHVRWTEEDREKVAEEFVLLRLTDPLGVTGTLLDQAQKNVLEVSRRRKFMLANEPKLRELMLSKFAEQVDSLRGEPIVIEKEKIVPAKTEMEVLSGIPLDILCSTAVSRFINERNPIAVPVDGHSAVKEVLPARSPVSSAINGTKDKKMRVLIIGVMRQQSVAIRNRVPQDIDLRFIDKEKAPYKIESSSDYVIVHKASHGWMQAAQANTNGNSTRVLYINDGVGALCQKIMDLRSQWIAGKGNVKV